MLFSNPVHKGAKRILRRSAYNNLEELGMAKVLYIYLHIYE